MIMDKYLYEISKMLEYVAPFYDSPLRFYHNRNHIVRMSDKAIDLVDDGLITEEEGLKLITAIIFHDVIQHPVQSTFSNEKLSAMVYEDYCLKNSEEKDWDVVDLILATEQHFNSTFIAYKPLTAWMMDLDLLAFTDDYEEFVQTNHDIENEFRPFFTEEDLKAGRKAFFKKIQDKEVLKFRIMDKDGSMTRKAYENVNQYIMENFGNE